MAQNYECVLLLDPTLPDEKVQSYVDQFSKIVTAAGGEITQTQPWGKRRMQYQIKRHSEAHYVLLCFKLETPSAAVVNEFERQVRINDDLLREMTVKTDKLRVMDPPAALSTLGSRPASRLRTGGRPDRRGPGMRPEAGEGGEPVEAVESVEGEQPVEAVADEVVADNVVADEAGDAE